SVMLWPTPLIKLLQPILLQLDVGLSTVLMILLLIPFMVLLAAVPHFYLMRSLRPLLAGAPRTNERITMREQLSKTAAVVSGKVLMAGLVAAIVTMGGGVLMLLGAFLNDEFARVLAYSAPLSVMGGLLTGYFLYLLRLKAKLNHVAA